jgi:hypothetical protein
MKLKILFFAIVGLSLSCFTACTSPKEAQAVPQVVSAKVVNGTPQYIANLNVSPVQRAMLAADSTQPIVVEVSFALPLQGEGAWAWLVRNWWVFLGLGLTIWEIFARSTPTEIDNTILAVLRRVLDLFLPNRKIGGGVHAA